MQMLSWMENHFQGLVAHHWHRIKNLSIHTPISRELDRHSVELFERLKELDGLLRQGFFTSPLLEGEGPTIADVALTCYVSFCQLVEGFTVSAYPTIQRICSVVQAKMARSWKALNLEYERFAEYVVSISKRDNLPRVSHAVFFQEAPHTVYEMILDPENDIFLFLASKTISTKTNAKLKRGLKKLNDGDGADGTGDGEKEKVPYQISLEVGGKFNVHHRQGVNLVLVPGSKIVQTSGRVGWPEGHHSTEIFELNPLPSSNPSAGAGAGGTRLLFTQMNCPLALLPESDGIWDKFWKKINGVRVTDVQQLVYFKGRTANQVSLPSSSHSLESLTHLTVCVSLGM